MIYILFITELHFCTSDENESFFSLILILYSIVRIRCGSEGVYKFLDELINTSEIFRHSLCFFIHCREYSVSLGRDPVEKSKKTFVIAMQLTSVHCFGVILWSTRISPNFHAHLEIHHAPYIIYNIHSYVRELLKMRKSLGKYFIKLRKTVNAANIKRSLVDHFQWTSDEDVQKQFSFFPELHFWR